jgi:hypothetical protein
MMEDVLEKVKKENIAVIKGSAVAIVTTEVEDQKAAKKVDCIRHKES